MDVVYIIGPDPDNEELRYSLRSVAANLPHDKIWTVGYGHPWLRGTYHKAVSQHHTTKWANVAANLEAACESRLISDDFVLMNDDFYILEPVEEIPRLHRGTIAEHRAAYPAGRSSAYLRGLNATRDLLLKQDIENPLSYALHMPMVVNRHDMAVTLHYLRENWHHEALHIRTLYGNMFGPRGTQAFDCKVTGHSEEARIDIMARDRGGPFLSTYDESFRRGEVGRWLRARFRDPSPYE